MRRRYVQSRVPPYELREVGDDYCEPGRGDAALWGDRAYHDLPPENGEDISTRTKHREYMRRHGVTTMDDFSDYWKAAEKAREAYRTVGKGGAVSREDIARAIAKLED